MKPLPTPRDGTRAARRATRERAARSRLPKHGKGFGQMVASAQRKRDSRLLGVRTVRGE